MVKKKRVNKSPEQDMLNAVAETLKGLPDAIVLNTNCRSHNMMDFVADLNIEGDMFHVRCEAKVVSQTGDIGQYANKHNVSHLIFGEILKGIEKDPTFNPNCCLPLKTGVLFKASDLEFFQKKFSKMPEGWRKFGECFECNIVLVFTESSGRLTAYEWDNFWEKRKDICVMERHQIATHK